VNRGYVDLIPLDLLYSRAGKCDDVIAIVIAAKLSLVDK